MASLHIETHGQGEPLVLLHGWGVNGGVFSKLVPLLADRFQLSVIDLPGFGQSQGMPAQHSALAMAELVAEQVPQQAIWLGWSLGGLVAKEAALNRLGEPKALVTVASSPRFLDEDHWPGIKPSVLEQFAASLDGELAKVIERFLAIQAMGSETARTDIKALREAVLARPLPSREALAAGLAILDSADLRPALADIRLPFLRLYGRLDALVPGRVIARVDELSPGSQSHTFAHASHAPFISHPREFVARLTAFADALA
ncbi:pimeloyl-ACP methyl ester esterase BioH [Gallaecimonas sp. GXIMD4217]|uniref:pimeloyl-ACP methyl ester esterase BioH n=1 Tax=Gallaecimonas sp. GXIMD4217 TaxID=3131927 RepID=UPI00311B13BF